MLISVPSAAVQCRLCDAPSTLTDVAPATPVRIEVQTSLNFDRLIVTSQAGGTIRLSPDGARSAQGGVAGAGSRAMVGSVIIRGEAGRMVRVDLPSSIELWGLAGGRVAIDRIRTDLPSTPRLDANGRLSFHFGGEVRLTGDAEGDYRGDVPITVEYL